MKFRKYILSTGREVYAGKDSKNNDKLVEDAKKDDILLHTNAPGSPFVNIGTNPSKKEIEEASIFCARYSQDYRDNKRDVTVDIFSRMDMKKDSSMKEGTWAVKDKESIKVKKSDILKLEKILHSSK